MKEVNIYIASSIKGRWEKDGHVGYILEYYKEGSKYPSVLTDYEPVFGVNQNRADMEALIRSVNRLLEKCILSIYTNSEYLYKALEGQKYMEKWKKNGWTTAQGREVKNKDKWIEIEKVLSGNMYKLYLNEPNAYMNKLQDELTRKEIANGRTR